MGNPSAPPGKGLKYARLEHERRFLLAGRPEGGAVSVRLTDRYLTGTRLRLRRSVEGDRTVRKLTQKVPGALTTIYLDEPEYEVLAAQPAAVLGKRRYRVPPLVVDVFEGPLAGLVLAEAEFESAAEVTAFVPPEWVVAEVTDDDRFTGGRLATTTAADLAALLAQYGVGSRK